MKSKNESKILKHLIDNADEAGVKPIMRNNGSILFQRHIDPPDTETIEDIVDDLDDTEPLAAEKQETNRESNSYQNSIDTPDLQPNDDDENQDNFTDFPKNSKKNNKEKTEQNTEEEELIDELDESNNFTSQPQAVKQPSNHIKAKPKLTIKSRSPPPVKKKILNNSTPENTPSSASKKRSVNSPIKRSSPSPIKHKYRRNSNNTNIFEILGYCAIILAILFGIIISNYDEVEEEPLPPNEFELEATFLLNDCVYPINSIPAINYPTSFIEYVHNGSSKYLKYDDETKSINVKTPRQSLFCKGINFGNRHPDVCGLFVIWMFLFVYYIHYSISRARAERIAPDVMRLLRSKNMCYLDEAKKKMKEDGHWLFGAWWQVKNIINSNDNVKTVKMVDTKPFWSFNDN